MPTLVAAYFAVYIVFCLWAHYQDVRASSLTAYSFVELGGENALVYVAASYWVPAFRAVPTAALLVIYSGAWLSLVVMSVVEGRKHTDDPELSFTGRVFVATAGNALALAISAPLLYWGWQSAVQSSYAAT